jgi:hypoxanthine phosphoribosyltransferase
MAGKKAARKSARFLRISWSRAARLSTALARKVREGGYRPDAIVGLGRGGWVPARILSDILGVTDAYSLGMRFYTGVGETARKPSVTQPVPPRAVRGKRVLVVDDVSDTGRSLLAAKAALAGAKELKIAALHFKPCSLVRPDYFASRTSKWVVYPWEKSEAERLARRRKV